MLCVGNSVGVREMSRLISRLRHRQFGIIVTTSFIDSQAYREIKEDQHPIVVVSAADIVGILKSHGYGDVAAVENWLDTEFSGRTVEMILLGDAESSATWLSSFEGRIVGVRDTFSAFNEPSAPISAEVTALTGITNEMVAGHRFDDAAIAAFAETAVVVIAHNSGFDRKFAERYWHLFEHKAWGCSMSEIDSRKHGFAGAKLGYLLNGAGFFHQAHRAVDDCHALLEVLAFELPTTGSTALALLLETAPKPTMRVWAEQTAFELKDSLKRRGYRWNDGSDGRPKSWFIDVDETALADEIAFLRTQIYMQDVEPGVQG